MLTLTPDTPILGAAPASYTPRFAVRRFLDVRGRTYGAGEVELIVGVYEEVCLGAGVNIELILAQIDVETTALTSPPAQPPRRNPAGIGITGPGVEGVRFPSWPAAASAHVGRMIAYATTTNDDDLVAPAAAGKPEHDLKAYRRRLVADALGWRSLPDRFRGIAPTLAQLAGTWAADKAYADTITRRGTLIRNS